MFLGTSYEYTPWKWGIIHVPSFAAKYPIPRKPPHTCMCVCVCVCARVSHANKKKNIPYPLLMYLIDSKPLIVLSYFWNLLFAHLLLKWKIAHLLSPRLHICCRCIFQICTFAGVVFAHLLAWRLHICWRYRGGGGLRHFFSDSKFVAQFFFTQSRGTHPTWQTFLTSKKRREKGKRVYNVTYHVKRITE